VRSQSGTKPGYAETKTSAAEAKVRVLPPVATYASGIATRPSPGCTDETTDSTALNGTDRATTGTSEKC
jgi:hypothetical protein